MFSKFSKLLSKQIEKMSEYPLLELDVDKDELWDTYLSSFPEGSNPIYKERTEHDCNCCKNFIRDVGAMVAVVDDKMVTIWDVEVGGHYQVVADAMAKKVLEHDIKDVYSHVSTKVGVEKTYQQLESGGVKEWNHFYGKVPTTCILNPTQLSEIRSAVAVLNRGLEEITDDAIETTLDLINSNSIYRGEEFKAVVSDFQALKALYTELNAEGKKLFSWCNYGEHGARIRNTAIGTLLQDISEGVGLDKAVASFEAKVAPQNYKRPAPVITKKMISDAMKVIEENGLETSLSRRFATIEDVSVNDILFVDREVRPLMKNSLESSLLSEVKNTTDSKNFSKLQEISIDSFIKEVLPKVNSMEVLFENKHQNNLVSLIAPKDFSAKNLFKWGNKFSWSYNGNLTDSIKQRVKNAGGNVDGYLRTSLSWFNFDDLDLHVKEPNGNEIFYSSKNNLKTKGMLDVDMNAGSGDSREAVENIFWQNNRYMEKGDYKIYVNQFCKRESIDTGFEVEIECQGDIYSYVYNKQAIGKIHVATLTFDGERITKIKKGTSKFLEEGSSSQSLWGINTNDFHKVSLLTLSPNHWGDSNNGNKHFIFTLDNCNNPEKARGFYNEFLPADLNKYRKVFEVLGDKTKCELADNQLSGLGFSSTKENSLVCRVSGNINRMIKIIF